MSRYDLKAAATLLGTGRTTLCQQLRDRHILNDNNLPARQHVTAGRFIVELKWFEHTALGQPKPYGKTLVTERGLLWLATTLNVSIHREAANDADA